MTKTRSGVLVLGGIIAIGIGLWFALTHVAPPNQGARDAAAALAMIGAASVGIERVVEMGWTTLGGILGEWWPLSIIRQQVQQLEDDLDPVVDKFYTEASSALQVARDGAKLTADELTAAKAELATQRGRLEAQLTELRRLAPDSQRAQLLSVTAKQNLDLIEAKFASFSDGVQQAVNEAKQSVTAIGDFVATFKDNPGKRLVSIWAGVVIGLFAAAILGLDVFVAVIGPEGAGPAGLLAAPKADPLGIIATGLVIGLGAGPTHEVVRVLQEVKKARKTENQATAG